MVFEPVPDANGRLGRAALFAFATTLAAAGCPSRSTAALYGGPPTPSRELPSLAPDGNPAVTNNGADPGQMVALYGAPVAPPNEAGALPPDANAPDDVGAADVTSVPDAMGRPSNARPPRLPRPPGSPAVRYGAPPVPDPSDPSTLV